jgi:hypothetical protein
MAPGAPKKDMASHATKEYSPTRSSGQSVSSSSKSKAYSPPLANDGKPLKADRQGVTAAFGQFSQLIQASKRPLPTQNGNGTYSAKNAQTGLREDLKYLKYKDFKTLLDLVKNKIKGVHHVDDKTMLMERVIQLVAGLPHNSKKRVELTNNFLSELWYTLEHPPSIYIGDQFKYRFADGSYNNIMYPQLGAAGCTYSRSVRPVVVPPGALPDPGLIFDSVMARNDYTKHPNNVSSVLWYWATIIIHGL